MLLSFICCIFVHFVTKSALSKEITWEPTNGPFGGRVNALAIQSNGHILAGTANGGLYRSTDNGDSWILSSFITDIYIRAITLSPNGNIFVATENNGIFRSLDNGENWTQINNGLKSLSVRALEINSKGDLFAGTGGATAVSLDR